MAAAFSDVDVIALSRYIVYLDSWLETLAELEKEGVITEGRRSGEEVLCPLARYWFRLEAMLRSIEQDFGLSPTSRMRLGIPLAPTHDPLASLKTAAVIKEYRTKLKAPAEPEER